MDSQKSSTHLYFKVRDGLWSIVCYETRQALDTYDGRGEAV